MPSDKVPHIGAKALQLIATWTWPWYRLVTPRQAWCRLRNHIFLLQFSRWGCQWSYFSFFSLLLIPCRPFDTLAIAIDLGNIQSTLQPVVWAIGVMRDPVVQFVNSKGQQEVRNAYYWSNYLNPRDVVWLLLYFCRQKAYSDFRSWVYSEISITH